MIVEAGHIALMLALTISMLQMILPLWGAFRHDHALMRMASVLASGGCACVLLAFFALVYAHVVSDFSVANVFENSHSQKPLVYKMTGVWGNHEGSMLLWVLILTLFGALVAVGGRSLPLRLQAMGLAVQGAVSTAFLSFIVLTSNPFNRLTPAPFEGQDLNPVLQDMGLAIHPPLLYIGYVGFSMAFSFAIAALMDGRIDAVWARVVRPWTLVVWAFLTLGIAMGSYWAYYELGWGGWWFWDPVENASLMPWLTGTALVHSTVVMQKREALKIWTILLAIVTFSLSLIGTFLVRSGVLTSVHAFAVDPARGMFILVILSIFIGGSLSLYAWRAPQLTPGGLFSPVSREGALVLNNLLLSTMAATVFIGTLYPLALEALTGEKISVGPPFFTATFTPLAIPLLTLLPFGPLMAWKRADLSGIIPRLTLAVTLGIMSMLVTVWSLYGGPVLAPVGVGLGVFITIGSASDILARIFPGSRSVHNTHSSAWKRAKGLPRAIWGSTLSHIGVGMLVLGMAATAWHTETIVALKVGESTTVGPYQARLERIWTQNGPNYRESVARFSLSQGGVVYHAMESAKRYYPARNVPTTEAGILTVNLFSQVYISLGEATSEGQLGVRLYWKPFVLLLWIGAILMAMGGILALTDKRLRLGVPVQARAAKRENIGLTTIKAMLVIGLLLVMRLGLISPAHAVQPDEILPDPQLEATARKISSELRCLVCQNQSIDESDAQLARDLRQLVRIRLAAGDDAPAIKKFIVERYGSYVLLNPPWNTYTWGLWLSPFMIMLAGSVGLMWTAHKRKTDQETISRLTSDETARLEAIYHGPNHVKDH